MKRVLILLIITLSTTLNSFAHDIKNAKKGSTVVQSFGVLDFIYDGLSTEGHAAIVVNEYVNDSESKFIVGAHSGGVTYDSYDDHIKDQHHFGHFRAVSQNYTFKQRELIVRAAKSAVGKKYKFVESNLPHLIVAKPLYWGLSG